MKSALLAITFATPAGGEIHWSESAPSVAICHGRAFSLAQWAASQGVEVRYGCRSIVMADNGLSKED